MSLAALNKKRTINYVIMLVLLLIFTAIFTLLILFIQKDQEKKEAIEKSPTLLKIRKFVDL